MIDNELPRYYKVIDANGESVELMILNPLDITFCLKVANDIVK